jgi:hypothetical protein
LTAPINFRAASNGDETPLIRSASAIRLDRHLFADLLIEKPNVNGGVIEFDRLLAVDGEAMPLADVLPMAAIESAAEIETAAIEYAMELSLRPPAIIEAIALPG